MIRFKGVNKTYNNSQYALKDVNIEIGKGEFVFLVGSSGAGKSTLIKMLIKEIEPSSGSLVVNGIDLVKLKRKEVPFYRRKIGVVFQDYRLIPTLNVYENVAFALRVTEASPRDIKKKVPMVLSLVGLDKKHNSFPGELSGGEQQRVSIARAIVNNPSLLIADEPSGNLDPETASGIMDVLNDINRAGTTIVMATHAKDIVDNMRKRVIVLKKGSVIRDEQRGAYGNED